MSKKDRFVELYDLYYETVLNSIWTKISSKDDALDICQEVFISFFNKMDEVQNPRAYLLGAVKNKIADYYRKKKGDDLDIEEYQNDVNLTFVNGMKDARILIQEILANNKIFETELEKNIFDMIAMYNYSYNQTADTFGLTKRKVEYFYKKTADRILYELKQLGIKHLEDIL